MAENNTAKRGFAAMDPERRREIASKGGKSSRRTDGKGNRSKPTAVSPVASTSAQSTQSGPSNNS